MSDASLEQVIDQLKRRGQTGREIVDYLINRSGERMTMDGLLKALRLSFTVVVDSTSKDDGFVVLEVSHGPEQANLRMLRDISALAVSMGANLRKGPETVEEIEKAYTEFRESLSQPLELIPVQVEADGNPVVKDIKQTDEATQVS